MQNLAQMILAAIVASASATSLTASTATQTGQLLPPGWELSHPGEEILMPDGAASAFANMLEKLSSHARAFGATPPGLAKKGGCAATLVEYFPIYDLKDNEAVLWDDQDPLLYSSCHMMIPEGRLMDFFTTFDYQIGWDLFIGSAFEWIKYAYLNLPASMPVNQNTLVLAGLGLSIPPTFFANSQEFLTAVLNLKSCAFPNETVACMNFFNAFLGGYIQAQAGEGGFVLWLLSEENCPVYTYEKTPAAAATLLVDQAFYPNFAWQLYGGPNVVEGQEASSTLCFSASPLR